MFDEIRRAVYNWEQKEPRAIMILMFALNLTETGAGTFCFLSMLPSVLTRYHAPFLYIHQRVSSRNIVLVV